MKTGGYEIRDSLIVLKVDTVLAVSLNTGTFAFMRVNCDPDYSMKYTHDGDSVILKWNIMGSENMKLKRMEEGEALQEKEKWPKQYLRHPPKRLDVQVCKDKPQYDILKISAKGRRVQKGN